MIDGKLEVKNSLILLNKESPDFWHFISELETVLYRNYMAPGRQDSAAHEIRQIIEYPLVYVLRDPQATESLQHGEMLLCHLSELWRLDLDSWSISDPFHYCNLFFISILSENKKLGMKWI